MRNALLLLGALVLTGCATVSHGPMQRIHVDSDIGGATVSLERCGTRTKIAKTPATVFVSRRATRCSIRVYAPGEASHVVHLERRVANAGETLEVAAFILDEADTFGELGAGMLFALPLMLASSTVDFASGAVFVQEPSEIFVSFFDSIAPPPDEEPLDPSAP